MDRKRSVLSALIMAALLGGFGRLVLRPHELSCHGKPLSRWLIETHEASVRGSVSEAEAVSDVRSLGTNALATLTRMASVRLYGLRRFVGDWANDKDFDFLHLPLQYQKHETAAWALKILGPQAQPAVPALARLLKDPDAEVRRNAARCLAGVGPGGESAIPNLIRLLGQSSRTNQEIAIMQRE